jgi:hypothetical protein
MQSNDRLERSKLASLAHSHVSRHHRWESVVRAVIPQIAFVVATLATPTADSQEPLRFTGQTTASPVLLHDALQPIASFVRDSLKCPRISQVDTEVLPSGAIERDASKPEGTASATYERWTVSYCQKTRAFLVVFWTNDQGVAMFRVQFRDGH